MRKFSDQQQQPKYPLDYHYHNDSRHQSQILHLSNSLHLKDQYKFNFNYYRKGSYNTPKQNDYYSKTAQKLEDRKNYDSNAGHLSTRSFLEDSSVKQKLISTAEKLNSSIQTNLQNSKYEPKDHSFRRQNSFQYKYQTNPNFERPNLQESRIQGSSPSCLIRSDQYFSNTQISPFHLNPYRKQTTPVVPEKKPNAFRQPLPPPLKEQPYFEYILRYSYRSKRGFAPNNPGKLNQDAFVTIPNINSQTFQHYFGVCDGHGVNGHLVSAFIKNMLPSVLSKINSFRNPKDQLLHSYKQISDSLLSDESIDDTYSGSTSVGCYLNHNKLYCCNVGDSRAIVGKRTKKGEWSAKPLTIDHKPCLQRQANRILKAGGRIDSYKDSNNQAVGPLRVWLKDRNIPGLAMTRSFGDTIASPVGVNAIPEIDQYTLSVEDRILVIASDGLWQFLSNSQVIQILSPFYTQYKIEQGCNKLLEAAISIWKQRSTFIDDITFVVLFLDYNSDKI